MLSTIILASLIAAARAQTLPGGSTLPAGVTIPATLPAGVTIPADLTGLNGITGVVINADGTVSIDANALIEADVTISEKVTVDSAAALTIAADKSFKTTQAVALEGGASVLLNAGATLESAGLVLAEGLATIQGGVITIAQGFKASVKAGSTLVVDGITELKGEFDAEADANVHLVGETTVSAATKMEGMGNYLVNGTLSTTGDAAVSLGKIMASTFNIASGSVVKGTQPLNLNGNVMVQGGAEGTDEEAVVVENKVTVKNSATLGDKSIVMTKTSGSVNVEGSLNVKAGKAMIKNEATSKTTVMGTGTVMVEGESELHVTNIDLNGGAKVTVAEGSMVKATMLACKPAAAGTTKSMITLNGDSMLSVDGMVALDATCEFAATNTDAKIELMGDGTMVSTVSGTTVNAGVLSTTNSAKVRFDAGAKVSGAVDAQADSEVHVAGTATFMGVLDLSDSAQVMVEEMAVLTVEDTVEVSKGTKLTVEKNGKAVVKNLSCGSAEGKADIALNGGTVMINGRFNLDANNCAFAATTDSTLLFAGSVEGDSAEATEKAVTSGIKAGMYQVSRLHAMGKATLIAEGQVQITGDVMVEGDADIEVRESFQTTGKLVLKGNGKVRSGASKSVKAASAEFDATTQFIATLAVAAEARTEASLVVTGEAKLAGDLIIDVSAALKTGDSFTVATYASKTGNFDNYKVMVAGEVTGMASGGRKRATAGDWTFDEGDKETKATYNGMDMAAKATPMPPAVEKDPVAEVPTGESPEPAGPADPTTAPSDSGSALVASLALVFAAAFGY